MIFIKKQGQAICLSFLLRLVMGNMKFYGLLDFFPRKEEIKNSYDLLTIDEIYNYKMYVYSLPFEEDYIKDLIWEYLNDWQEAIFDLSKHYRRKKQLNEKRKQRYKNEDKNTIETI